jgi:hypothetical protein
LVDISIIGGGFFKLGKVRRTGQVLRTWNLGSCKVGLGTLEEIFYIVAMIIYILYVPPRP